MGPKEAFDHFDYNVPFFGVRRMRRMLSSGSFEYDEIDVRKVVKTLDELNCDEIGLDEPNLLTKAQSTPAWLPMSEFSVTHRKFAFTAFFETELEAKIFKALEINRLIKHKPFAVHKTVQQEVDNLFSSIEFIDFLRNYPDTYIEIFEEMASK